MLLACGDQGLMAHQNGWRALPCPLNRVDMIARDHHRIALLDNTTHAVWTGRRIIPVDSGIESMLLWQDCLLTLSGDTDCLTLLSGTGVPLFTTPAGVYPQDMCLLPGQRSLAVCGGADSTLRIIRLPELQEEQAIRLHGSVQRAACLAGMLYTLCTLEDDGLCCEMCRIQGNRWQPLARWPGLPGCLHADAAGGLWAASSERLGFFRRGEYHAVTGEFGLIRHMDSHQGTLLASDPVLGQCLLVSPRSEVHTLYAGDVQHAVFRQ